MSATKPLDTAPRKVAFSLRRDEDGYPPADSEGLWAIPTDNPFRYIVDNIPFFVEGIALGDEIDAAMQEDLLTFRQMVQDGGHSTLWAFADDPSIMASLRETLRNLGLRTESDPKRGMLAIDVPPQADYSSLRRYLQDGEQAGKWEYAEGAVRHNVEETSLATDTDIVDPWLPPVTPAAS